MTVIVHQKVNIYWNMTVIVHQKVNLLKHDSYCSSKSYLLKHLLKHDSYCSSKS